MGSFASWVRTRKATATALALTLLAGVPLTFAVLHQGFPVTDPDLDARDVWVTNAKDLLAGRLNKPIGELDAAVNTATNEFDVLQNGDDAAIPHDNAEQLFELMMDCFDFADLFANGLEESGVTVTDEQRQCLSDKLADSDAFREAMIGEFCPGWMLTIRPGSL